MVYLTLVQMHVTLDQTNLVLVLNLLSMLHPVASSFSFLMDATDVLYLSAV
jgi:hypothetical protein